MDFCLLLKVLAKIKVNNLVKNVLRCQKSAIDEVKTTSKLAIQKTAEAYHNLDVNIFVN